MTAEGIVAAVEAQADGWGNEADRKSKRSIDQLRSVNGHRLRTIEDSQNGWGQMP